VADRETVQSIVIKAPIKAVWAEITRLRGKQRFMLDSVLETTLEPGAPLYYKSEDGKRIFVVGRVIEVEPPRRFVHTFLLTMRDDPLTVLAWELAEVDDGTRVTLRQSGWPADAKGVEKVDATWTGILTQLKHVLETGDIPRSAKVRYALMHAFSWALPAKTKAGNVSVPDGRP
jgi:uncharacterized protein YndB with AHSA1/START domain